MAKKLFSYLSAAVISGYITYLDYSFVQRVTLWAVSRIFPAVSRYDVHTLTRYIFYLTGAFIILVYSMYFIFYVYFKGNERPKPPPHFYPMVSIVIPAYNEADNIGRLIESIQYQDYPFECYEIIVVDDGSTDKTGRIAAQYGVKVIRHEKNLGKAKSLEDGIRAARGDVIITMDGDSYFADGSSLRNIVESLYTRPSVGVSTGVIRIEEGAGGIIEKFQVIEFLHSFEVGRRVQGYLDWLLVVPGAFSAFKSYILKSLPSIPKDTLAEDFELGMIAAKMGFTLNFEPRARVYTRPVLSWKRLYHQRVRWYYGGLQVMKKYQEMILRKEYGDKGLFLFFHVILLEYILPVLQVFGIVTLPVILTLQELFGIRITDINLPLSVIVVVFILVLTLQYIPGVVMSSLAMLWERGFKMASRYLPFIFLYYVFYNPFLSFAKVDGMIRLMKGETQRW